MAILKRRSPVVFSKHHLVKPKDPNVLDEFHVSFLQEDTTSVLMQPYSKYLVGVNALILALIVPGGEFQWRG